ncbi:MAG: hypothetical protein K2X62_07515 [Beijerinckiaceae bacterium]|jgi:hypothetical protein|nr:hypothetical protein [Beijerinckiaceae bacterium]
MSGPASAQPLIRSTAEARDVWRRISRQHIALGSNCTCGVGLSINIEDFGQDICDFLEADAMRAGRDDVLQAMSRLRPHGRNEPWTLPNLLDALATHDDPGVEAFMTERLNVSLESIVNAHRRTSMRCD